MRWMRLLDITERLYDNPKSIFGLSPQPDTFVEVAIDRSSVWPVNKNWSPLAGTTVRGSVERVVLNETVVFMDGSLTKDVLLGRDISVQAQVVQKEAIETEKKKKKRPEMEEKAREETVSEEEEERAPAAGLSSSASL
ncbi:hypothetical protein G6F68_015853 [Rhizopus microsporus]|nr:hypothetical protein G6F68_015853 [Rhizopus microsporus]